MCALLIQLVRENLGFEPVSKTTKPQTCLPSRTISKSTCSVLGSLCDGDSDWDPFSNMENVSNSFDSGMQEKFEEPVRQKGRKATRTVPRASSVSARVAVKHLKRLENVVITQPSKRFQFHVSELDARTTLQ